MTLVAVRRDYDRCTMASARSPNRVALFQASARAAHTPFAQRSSTPGSIDGSHPHSTVPPTGSATLRPRPPLLPQRTPEGKARGLSARETSMARSLFADAVDYRLPRVHNEKYLPFGLQPDDTAMTPNGEMYFSPTRFEEDFSLTFAGSQWFMHEMVHVWQYQLDYPVKLRGAFRIGLGYRYTLLADKRLRDYNMEAQGNLLADYWAVSQFASPLALFEEKHRGDIALFREVLTDFLANPSHKKNLPG